MTKVRIVEEEQELSRTEYYFAELKEGTYFRFKDEHFVKLNDNNSNNVFCFENSLTDTFGLHTSGLKPIKREHIFSEVVLSLKV